MGNKGCYVIILCKGAHFGIHRVVLSSLLPEHGFSITSCFLGLTEDFAKSYLRSKFSIQRAAIEKL